MRADDIKVGMWVRDPDTAAANSHVLFVAANGGWRNVARVAVGLGMSADDVLYAGDLLWERGQTAAATACLRASGWMSAKPSAKRAMGRVTRVAADLSGVEVPVDRFEDANDAFAESIRRAAAMQRAEAQKAKSLAQPSAASADANTTCVHCGGMAYLGLQEARCLAPKCERVEPEPEVRELWVGFRHEKRPGERGIRDALLAPMGPEYERWWQATGRGVTKNHPIREEAIRLWREAVFRG